MTSWCEIKEFVHDPPFSLHLASVTKQRAIKGATSTTTMSEIIAQNHDNQPLIDALLHLSRAEESSQQLKKANFRAAALRRAARGLARKRSQITSGESVSQGSGKVKGVGPGTAYYINEFLAHGKIAELEQFEQQNEQDKRKQSEKPKEEEVASETRQEQTDKQAEKEANENQNDPDDTIIVNRAPVLTLWVTVVAERNGFTRQEALTYGKWVAGILAQAKGKAEGRFSTTQSEDHQGPPSKKRKRDDNDLVQFFGDIKVPVQKAEEGQRYAPDANGEDTVDPDDVQEYLERVMGDKLKKVQEAMQYLAKTKSKEKLKEEAYELYEDFRPAYKGWGQKSELYLSKIRGLADTN